MLNGNVATTTFATQGEMEFGQRGGFGSLLTVDDGAWVSGDRAPRLLADTAATKRPVEMMPIPGGYGRRNPTGSRATDAFTTSSASTRV